MEIIDLYKLYKQNSDSVVSFELFEHEIAWLTFNNWSVEFIFFSINYSGKWHREQLSMGLKETLDSNKVELLRYYEIAKEKQAIQKGKKVEAEYDSENKLKRSDSQSWFRKGIDFNLFE